MALLTVVVFTASTGIEAQRQGQAGQPQPGQGAGRGRGAVGAEFAGPPQGPDDVPIVEVVGCLSENAARWVVMNATEPVKAAAGFSRPEEVKAAEMKPLGTLRFDLIGLVELSPETHKGHKVVVKGLLITEASNPRLNVTSLMTASASCAK